MTDAQALRDQYADQLIEDPNVSSVGIGQDENGNKILIIGVKHATQSFAVPAGLDNEDYKVEEVGEFTPEVMGTQLLKPQADRKVKHRPVPGGVSAGHEDVTAGTTSYILEDGSGRLYMASNNHVFANTNNANLDDPIYQPGSADGGTADDTALTLDGWRSLEDGVTVDLAWAGTVDGVDFTTEILGVGKPAGSIKRAEVGDIIIKGGRTTGVTEGEVLQTGVTLDVNYGDKTITLKDQFLTEDMSDPGDSGSAGLLKGDLRPVGLLFAGSSTRTVFNEASNIKPNTNDLEIVTESGSDPGVPTASVTLSLTSTNGGGGTSGDIAVTVTDSDGNPIQGATVAATGADQTYHGNTNESGQVAFEAVPIQKYTIEASAQGYEQASTSISEGDFV